MKEKATGQLKTHASAIRQRLIKRMEILLLFVSELVKSTEVLSVGSYSIACSFKNRTYSSCKLSCFDAVACQSGINLRHTYAEYFRILSDRRRLGSAVPTGQEDSPVPRYPAVNRRATLGRPSRAMALMHESARNVFRFMVEHRALALRANRPIDMLVVIAT